MSSSGSPTSPTHTAENVRERLKHLLHSEGGGETGVHGGKEAGEESKEQGSQGPTVEPHAFDHDGGGPSPSVAPKQPTTAGLSIAHRWERLRQDRLQLASSRLSQAEVEVAITEGALRRASMRKHLARSRQSLAQQWHELEALRLARGGSKDSLEVDEEELAAQHVKMRDRGHVVARTERAGEDDQVMLEEEQSELARDWIELASAKQRIESAVRAGEDRL